MNGLQIAGIIISASFLPLLGAYLRLSRKRRVPRAIIAFPAIGMVMVGGVLVNTAGAAQAAKHDTATYTELVKVHCGDKVAERFRLVAADWDSPKGASDGPEAAYQMFMVACGRTVPVNR